MQVRIEIDGVFSMEVDDNATVEDLKIQIRQTLGLRFPQLQLNGVILQSNSTLRSYQIPSHSHITVLDMYFITCMVARTKIGITFHLPYTLFVHKGNTFGDLRLMLQTKHGIDMTNMRFELLDLPGYEPTDNCAIYYVGLDADTTLYVSEN